MSQHCVRIFHLGANSDESAGHCIHEVVLLSKERHDPAVDRLARQFAWGEVGVNLGYI